MQYTYKIQQLVTSSVIVRSDGAILAQDPDNIDYQQYLAWLEEGNQVQTSPKPLVRDWEKLSATLYSSSLYQEHLRIATKSAPSQIADRLWWIDKDLTTVLVNWVSSQEDWITHQEMRLNQLSSQLKELIATLELAEFPITETHQSEILGALRKAGFDNIADLLIQELVLSQGN